MPLKNIRKIGLESYGLTSKQRISSSSAMVLSHFSLNPCTSSSLGCKYTKSQSLYLLLRDPQAQSLVASRALGLKISCSQQVVQVDTYHHDHRQPQRVKVPFESTKQRKKRKPKPSFFEQIRDKWSAKLGSTRDRFPWQEQQEQENEDEATADKEKGTQKSSDAYVGEIEDVKATVKLSSTMTSAPWAHGTKPFKPQVHPEPETPRNVDGVGGHGSSDMIRSSGRFHRDFSARKDSISKGTWEEEERIVSAGFSLDKSSSWNAEDVNSVGSSYDSSVLELDSESGEGEKVRKRRSNTSLAEKMLPEHELKRLRNVSLRMLERTKVGAIGITQALVAAIHDKWKLDEVVKLKFEEPLSLNMKRTHEILESKTGGLIIWRSGSSVVLYRGMNYNLPCVQSYTKIQSDTTKWSDLEGVTSDATHNIQVKDSVSTANTSPPMLAENVKDLSKGDIMHLNELNQLLDELGPRFMDWSGREPLPIDADLLPAVVPDYKTPFRLLPYGVKQNLRDREMTKLRRLARTMPPHFALGRNRELQGLANAMVKLWEKSAIAKIAIKRGVQNTCNERMAEELKRLTGGTLLSRNKDFIVLYRGNDFLPPGVTEVLKERRKLRDLQQDEEEQARKMAPSFVESKTRASSDQLVAGTLAETMAATARWGNQLSNVKVEKMRKDTTLARHASIIRHLERKLAVAKGNLKKAEKALAKVQEDLDPTDLPNDLETLTDEERFLFRKIGLSMKPFLLLGRRGVYDGTIENMHLHWKYRELVKIIVRGKSFEHVKQIAISLEAESDGVLVSIDKTTKGTAIIVYRGKNYQSPIKLRPRNLLTRRQALARSIELQRREALRRHISDLQERIELLKSELEESRNEKIIDAEGMLHSTMEDSLLSDDEAIEDEGEEAYLEVYDSGNDENNNENEELREVD